MLYPLLGSIPKPSKLNHPLSLFKDNCKELLDYMFTTLGCPILLDEEKSEYAT